ncbi:hypothetical protein Bpfe_000028 [Biomphalaria pfeifferi]|uniref:Reverse transcriptase domain-containing protein n=1 Tax=Biomphalaria pfeifferi TaxID=112525 RepID=A0AAD8CBR2_BIOPF|nr:hypothetical protein Bpfe_000028 [Biomphalaria pfeifferi]
MLLSQCYLFQVWQTRSCRKSMQNEGKVHNLQEDTEEEIFSLSTNTNKLCTKINIDRIDTGSGLSIMTIKDYKKIFKRNPKLECTNVRLRTYTGEEILPLGKAIVIVYNQHETKKLPLYILSKGSNPLLGHDWIRSLKINWSDIKQLITTESCIQENINCLIKEFEEVFLEGIGTVKNMQATIAIKDDAKPKFCNARPVPYAIKAKVEKELNKLENEGILSKVNYSNWATPIVPIMKPSGEVQICGDFKVTINPVLKVEQYSLPRIEDILANLEKGDKFSKIDIRQAYLTLQLDEASKHLTTINTTQRPICVQQTLFWDHISSYDMAKNYGYYLKWTARCTMQSR